MSLLLKWIESENAVNGRKSFRLTPAQWAEWSRLEMSGGAPARAPLDRGVRVEPMNIPSRATGDNVHFAPRDDLFSDTDRETGFQVVSLATDVTAVPDNVALVEVVSAGELVTNVKAGDLAFLDFYSVKQGFVLSAEELYIAGSDALCGLFDNATQTILPLDNYVVTRRAKRERFEVALTGTDRVAVPPMITSVAGGRTSLGNTSTEVLYEEVVSVGRLTNRPRPGVMTRAERELLNRLCDMTMSPASDEEQDRLVFAVVDERALGRPSDLKPGELVVFCQDIAQAVRCKGEFQHLVPYDNVLGVIDDEALLDRAIRSGRAGKLKLAV